MIERTPSPEAIEDLRAIIETDGTDQMLLAFDDLTCENKSLSAEARAPALNELREWLVNISTDEQLLAFDELVEQAKPKPVTPGRRRRPT